LLSIDETERQLLVVHIERLRQERLKLEGRFKHTLADGELQDEFKLAMVLEEVAEVGKNLLARAALVQDGDASLEAIYTEVTQVAALSVAWMERLEYEITTQSPNPPYVRSEPELHNEIAAGKQALQAPFEPGQLQGSA
jgi:hypothetical protein